MRDYYDLAVVGAGPAGFAAAVTAARLGATVLLVEQLDRLGGAVALGLHPYICGLYRNAPDDPFDPLNKGLARELMERMDAGGGYDGRRRIGRVEVHAIQTERYRTVLDEVVAESKNLHGVVRTAFKTARIDGRRIGAIELESPEGRRELVAVSAVVDASGRGAVIEDCASASAPPAAETQAAGYCFRIAKVNDPGRIASVKTVYTMRRAVEQGLVPPELKFTTYMGAPEGFGGICKLCLPPRAEYERLDRARELAVSVHARLRALMSEFAASTIVEWSPQVLSRGGMVLRGKYRLEEEDVLDGRRFADACARAAWPVEFWNCTHGPQLLYPAPGTFYEIPARCLQSDSVTNLFAAGRCISGSQRALASARVAGTCLALGEAAARIALKSICNGGNRDESVAG